MHCDRSLHGHSMTWMTMKSMHRHRPPADFSNPDSSPAPVQGAGSPVRELAAPVAAAEREGRMPHPGAGERRVWSVLPLRLSLPTRGAAAKPT